MIKRWSNFNESVSTNNFKDEVNKIRQYFMEYEDDNIVSYDLYVCGKKENQMIWSVNPNNGNFDRWLQSQTEEAERYLNEETYRQFFLHSDLDKHPFFFCANIKIKSYYGILDDFGVDKLKDILVTWDRLKDSYGKVTIDMNSQSEEYKPVKLKVYFNPIVD